MNTAMSQENRVLQHDNKQLNALIKEYEQTLESLMSANVLYPAGSSLIFFFLHGRCFPESRCESTSQLIYSRY